MLSNRARRVVLAAVVVTLAPTSAAGAASPARVRIVTSLSKSLVTKPTVRVAARAPRSGSYSLRLTLRVSGGKVTTAGRRTVKLKARRQSTVSVALNAEGRRLVRRCRTLAATATLTRGSRRVARTTRLIKIAGRSCGASSPPAPTPPAPAGPAGPGGMPSSPGPSPTPGPPSPSPTPSTGPSGASGTSGSTGTSGPTGTSGSSGASGSSGPSGSSGASGASGTSGSSGASGSSGSSGATGALAGIIKQIPPGVAGPAGLTAG